VFEIDQRVPSGTGGKWSSFALVRVSYRETDTGESRTAGAPALHSIIQPLTPEGAPQFFLAVVCGPVRPGPRPGRARTPPRANARFGRSSNRVAAQLPEIGRSRTSSGNCAGLRPGPAAVSLPGPCRMAESEGKRRCAPHSKTPAA